MPIFYCILKADTWCSQVINKTEFHTQKNGAQKLPAKCMLPRCIKYDKFYLLTFQATLTSAPHRITVSKSYKDSMVPISDKHVVFYKTGVTLQHQSHSCCCESFCNNPCQKLEDLSGPGNDIASHKFKYFMVLQVFRM